MSYILDALKKAERERGITQVPTLMTVHETRQAADRNRLWVISGVCLVCAAAIVWFAISFLRTAGAPTPSSSAVAARVPPEEEPSSVQTTPASSSGRSMPAEGRSPSISQQVSSSAPRADVPLTDLAERNKTGSGNGAGASPGSGGIGAGTEGGIGSGLGPYVVGNGVKTPGGIRTMIQPGAQPEPAKNASSPASEETTAKPLSLREAMAKMKISILLYDEARSERMVFINDRKYVEGDYVDGRYLLESITADGVVLSFQGERAMLRASK